MSLLFSAVVGREHVAKNPYPQSQCGNPIHEPNVNFAAPAFVDVCRTISFAFNSTTSATFGVA
jgi:hypothetical protein